MDAVLERGVGEVAVFLGGHLELRFFLYAPGCKCLHSPSHWIRTLQHEIVRHFSLSFIDLVCMESKPSQMTTYRIRSPLFHSTFGSFSIDNDVRVQSLLRSFYPCKQLNNNMKDASFAFYTATGLTKLR